MMLKMEIIGQLKRSPGTETGGDLATSRKSNDDDILHNVLTANRGFARDNVNVLTIYERLIKLPSG